VERHHRRQYRTEDRERREDLHHPPAGVGE
jgi:hypothetical protein